MLIRLAIVLLVLNGLAMPTGSKADDEGTKALGRGDYAAAYQHWLPLAEAGHVSSQSNIANLYNQGLGVPQDFDKALYWYRKAADQGHGEAHYQIGNLHNNGDGVPQDYRIAVSWWIKAAKLGVAPAQYNVGLAYSRGHGISQDFVQSYVWLSLSVSAYQALMNQGFETSRFRDEAIKNSDLVATSLTPKQIKEAENQMRQWRVKMP